MHWCQLEYFTGSCNSNIHNGSACTQKGYIVNVKCLIYCVRDHSFPIMLDIVILLWYDTKKMQKKNAKKKYNNNNFLINTQFIMSNIKMQIGRD